MNDPVMKVIHEMFIPEKPLQPSHYITTEVARLEELEPRGFDEWDNDLFHDLCGKRQGPVVQDLLILLSQVDTTEASFGVNADKFMKMVVPMMKKLREACLDDFKEL